MPFCGPVCCSSDYSAMTRIIACYPTDDRSMPIIARVRELISWSVHDMARFAPVPEIIFEKVYQDIQHRRHNNAMVGVTILSRLLETVVEANLVLSRTLTSIISLFIESRDHTFIESAEELIKSLFAHAKHHTLDEPVKQIARAYISLCKEKEVEELAFNGLSSLIQQSNVTWLPIHSILSSIKNRALLASYSSPVLASLGRAVVPITLPIFANEVFSFFDQENIWSDPGLLYSYLFQMMTEMQPNTASAFFRQLLESLPPKSSDAFRSYAILDVSIRLLQQIPPEKALAQSRADSFSLVLLFVLNIDQLDVENKVELLDMSYQLASLIISNFSRNDVSKQAHMSLWSFLPTGEEGSTHYDESKLLQVLKFAQIFDSNGSECLTKKLLNDSLNKLIRFILNFEHKDEIFEAILTYLHSLSENIPSALYDNLVPSLLALQGEVSTEPVPKNMTIHSFIMCAFDDISQLSNAEVTEYLTKVAQNRLNATPVQVDVSREFVVKRFPEALSIPAEMGTLTFLYDGDEIKARCRTLRSSGSGVFNFLTDFRMSSSFLMQEEEDTVDSALLMTGESLPQLVYTDVHAETDSDVSDVPPQLVEVLEKVSTHESTKANASDMFSAIEFTQKGKIFSDGSEML